MKGKTISAIIIALLLAFSLLTILPVQSTPTAEMYIAPSYVDGGLDPTIPSTFTVTVMLKDFTDLFTWGLVLGFDPAVLECTAFRFWVTLPGDVFDVLAAPTRLQLGIPGTIDNVAGEITLTSQSLTDKTLGGVNGVPGVSYKLMEVDFKVVGYSSSISPIVLKHPGEVGGTYWTNRDAVMQPCIYTDGGAETVTAPLPYGPTAKFTWLKVIPENGTDVTFDATSSKGGFNGVNMCPITCWRWNFGDGTGWFNCSDKEVWVHNFAAPGLYTVYLEVYAPGAVPETDSVTHDVRVIPPPMGAYIDLMAPTQTPYNGTGTDVECDAFTPQQLVILKAKVTYNLDPVEGKLVGFEVTDANGDCVTYRTATTDASGQAEVEFRIPSMPAFGTWLATAIVDVAGTTVADTMTFEVGWIIEIKSVTPETGTYHKCEMMYFIIAVKSISLITRVTTMTVVVYDECGVPIGQIVITAWEIEARATVEYITVIGIHVPSWAFVGKATVYANAFTDLPSANGVPYCPEKDAEFLIERIP